MGRDGETSGEAPRRRTVAERQAIVTEAFEEGHSVSEVAERHGVSTASIYLWRRQAREGAIGTTRKTQGRSHPPSPVTLVPVRISPAAEAPMPTTTRIERIEIALSNGRILRVCDSMDPVKLVRLVAALESDAP
jgi:transposase